MNSTSQPEITKLLDECGDDPSAANRLFVVVYEELRRIANREFQKEHMSNTLQPTALVHEVWVRLVGKQDSVKWNSRGHFFVAASEGMRRILVDAARKRTRLKRGGGAKHVELKPDDLPAVFPDDDDLLTLNDALEALETVDRVKADLVKLRYFGGMTNAEVSTHLGISTATGERYWSFAKAWLRARMQT